MQKPEIKHDTCDVDHGDERLGQFLVSCGDSPELLQLAHASFHHVSAAIRGLDQPWPAIPILHMFRAAHRNHIANLAAYKPLSDLI